MTIRWLWLANRMPSASVLDIFLAILCGFDKGQHRRCLLGRDCSSADARLLGVFVAMKSRILGQEPEKKY